ncbi:MAG: multiple sugar transport system permease protein, partial [Granulosicoccus sp.]
MTDVAAKKHHTKSGLWARITSPKNRGPLLIAPAIIVLFVMNIFPLLWSFGLSFFNYRANRLNVPEFVGLKNFERVLTDEKIWDRFQTTAIIVGSSVTLQLIIGFSLAMLFAKHFPMRRIIMMLVLTPMMLSFVSVGVFFKLYYEPTFGLLSWFINLFTTEPFALLSTSTGALIGIIFADAWMWSPFVMLLVLAGLVSVPKYLYEAAEIDRVSSWRRFVTITLPYIKSLLLLAILFRTIETFKIFDIIYIITEGGPGSSTESIAVNIYRMAFQNFRTSRAGAL